jgi:putative transposase
MVETCSLDPGVCTFQTIYCDDGTTHKIGNNVTRKLSVLLKKLEKKNTTKNVTDSSNERKKKEAKNRFKRRIRRKIKNMVDDLHWKTANSVCKLAGNVLIGNMSTSSILADQKYRGDKKLLQTLSHFTFRQRLQAKCAEYGVKFTLVNESYTSKTCGVCGRLHGNLGGNREFKCPSCNFTIDRDVNGARNIMIKQLQ